MLDDRPTIDAPDLRAERRARRAGPGFALEGETEWGEIFGRIEVPDAVDPGGELGGEAHAGRRVNDRDHSVLGDRYVGLTEVTPEVPEHIVERFRAARSPTDGEVDEERDELALHVVADGRVSDDLRRAGTL